MTNTFFFGDKIDVLRESCCAGSGAVTLSAGHGPAPTRPPAQVAAV